MFEMPLNWLISIGFHPIDGVPSNHPPTSSWLFYPEWKVFSTSCRHSQPSLSLPAGRVNVVFTLNRSNLRQQLRPNRGRDKPIIRYGYRGTRGECCATIGGGVFKCAIIVRLPTHTHLAHNDAGRDGGGGVLGKYLITFFNLLIQQVTARVACSVLWWREGKKKPGHKKETPEAGIDSRIRISFGMWISSWIEKRNLEAKSVWESPWE